MVVPAVLGDITIVATEDITKVTTREEEAVAAVVEEEAAAEVMEEVPMKATAMVSVLAPLNQLQCVQILFTYAVGLHVNSLR